MALNEKQRRFVAEYLKDLNATQAAIRAGYAAGSAHTTASRMLKNDKVAEAIADAMEKRGKRVEITQDAVLRELAKIAFADLRNVMTPSGGLRSPLAWDDETAGAITSLEVVTRRLPTLDDDEAPEVEYVHKIKTADKLGSLTLLARHLGMLDGKPEDPDAKAVPLSISINVNPAVGDVRVTAGPEDGGDDAEA